MPWLLFFSAAVAGPAASDLAAVAERLRGGDWTGVPACVEVLEFRRDVIASDPTWTSMTLLPRPGMAGADRFLALVFQAAPPPEQVRDLRYLAARNRLHTAELA